MKNFFNLEICVWAHWIQTRHGQKNVRRNEGNYEYCGDYRCFQRMGREFAMQLDRGLHSVDEFWLIARRGSRLKEIASGMQHTVKNFAA